MELLEHLEDRGYPAEYLLSRIRGRRSRLITDWRPLIYDAGPLDYLASSRYQGFVRERSAEGIWKSLIREYRWVYTQLNEELRKLFTPFFLHAELRTLFICLRHMGDRKAGGVDELLSLSLLSPMLKAALLESVDLPEAVRRIERAFAAFSPRFGGLTEIYDAEGLRGGEQFITNTYLSVAAEQRLPPLLREFFSRLIDSRNILGLYKNMRLEEKARAPFIAGGSIAAGKLKAVLEKGDLFGISAVVREFSGIRIGTPDPTQVEMALYKGITRFLRRAGRSPFGVGPILDYLWRCSLEVMNLSVLLYGKDLERDTVAAELVQ